LDKVFGSESENSASKPGKFPCIFPGNRELSWRELDRRIAAFDAEFVAAARADEPARRLSTIPGIGAINATALVAAVGDARSFARARDLATWLGLVPRQATTGGRPKAARHYQTRQQIPSDAAYPWRAGGAALAAHGREPAWQLKKRARWAASASHRPLTARKRRRLDLRLNIKGG